MGTRGIAALCLVACTGCALFGESAARARWRELVSGPTTPELGPVINVSSTPTEEEADILRKNGLGLEDCLRLAILHSDRIKAQVERIYQNDLDQLTALSAMGPRVDYVFQWYEQDPVTMPIEQFFPNQYRLHDFRITQPIFRGLRDFFGLAVITDRQRRVEAETRALKLATALSTGRAFYAVLALERAIDTLAHSLELESIRLTQIRAREATGIARRTERLFVETQRARTQAALDRARLDVAALRAELGFFTGAPDATLIAGEPVPREPAPLASLLDRAKDRPDMAALGHEVKARRHEAHVASGEFLPSIDVTANLYAERAGPLSSPNFVHWDVLVGLDWPIFESGRSIANVRRTQSRVREAEFEYASALDRSRASIRVAYYTFGASLAQIPSLEARVRSAEENLRLLDGEYRTGIATNIELVDAENTRREATLDLDRALYEARRLELELRAAAGDEMLVPGPYPSSPRDALENK